MVLKNPHKSTETLFFSQMAVEFIRLINNGPGKNELTNAETFCHEMLNLKIHDTVIEIRVYTNKKETITIAGKCEMNVLTGQLEGADTLVFDT